MVVLIYFVVIDDSLYGRRDKDTEGDKNHMSSVYDDPGKSFLILLSYKNCISYTRDQNSVCKKIVSDLYMLIFVNHFWYC